MPQQQLVISVGQGLARPAELLPWEFGPARGVLPAFLADMSCNPLR